MNREAALKLLFQEARRMALEYIEEAEHQDGREYWEQFEDDELLTQDFQLYVVNRQQED